MLRATHSVLKPGAPTCFYVIANAIDLTDAGRKRIRERDGNDHLETPVPYEVLMQQAGFARIELADITSRYIETIRAWKEAWEDDADALIELVGEDEFARRLHNRRLDIANAEDGLTRRYRVSGTKDAPPVETSVA